VLDIAQANIEMCVQEMNLPAVVMRKTKAVGKFFGHPFGSPPFLSDEILTFCEQASCRNPELLYSERSW
jgi:hypothetical protein